MDNFIYIIVALLVLLCIFLAIRKISFLDLREFDFFPQDVKNSLKESIYNEITMNLKKDFDKKWSTFSDKDKNDFVTTFVNSMKNLDLNKGMQSKSMNNGR